MTTAVVSRIKTAGTTYEVRHGGRPIHDPASDLQGSWPKAGAAGGGDVLNHVNLTKCVTTAELDFTQGTATTYLDTEPILEADR